MRKLIVSLTCLLAVSIGQLMAAETRPATTASSGDGIREAIDGYLDSRWLAPDTARKSTQDLIARLHRGRSTPADVEQLLRSSRARYPAPLRPGELLLVKGLTCEHVDYTTSFFLFVPKGYDASRPTPLLLIGHGGNGAMSEEYATQAALGGLAPWIPVAAKHNFVLAAPLTERGWGPIGNSILFTLISHLERRLNIDPDRIYVTGHSMGGHLAWRSGIYLADRWGAVSPMSGGYDYVETREVYPLVNVPGYSTFGKTEPYNINRFNLKIKDWMVQHGYDWQLVEKPGGHEIYEDELPKVAEFLLAHPRNLYRPAVYVAAGKSVETNSPGENEKWQKKHQWNPARPIPSGIAHWVRLFPLPQETPADKAKQQVWAENLGENRFRITSQNAPRVRLYLHPRMVDFNKPVEVIANGVPVFKQLVTPSITTMLELAREFDDRGRVFHAAIDVDIKTDAAEAPVPPIPPR